MFIVDTAASYLPTGAVLLTKFNNNLSMDKLSHAQ